MKSSLFIIMVAVIVAAFVSLYPVMDCEDHGCPNAAHSALGAAATTCVAGVIFAARSFLEFTDGKTAALRFASDAMFSQTFTLGLFRPPKD